MNENNKFEEEKSALQVSNKNYSRRKFLAYAGMSASVFAVSCQKDMNGNGNKEFEGQGNKNSKDKPKNVVNLGHGDIGILNYAYALEQLEAAFYTRVTQNFYAGISAKERIYLEDIRDHEIAHREFFRTVLGPKAIGTLDLDFTSINFNSRDSVLGTAKAFEDLGVSAYNGAGELLESADYLLFAGKIVSVEARHAAAIRDMLNYGSFADNTVVNNMGLDVVRTPAEVLSIAGNYIDTRIIANNLPTS